jgi:Protein of unknown function (DUF2778)
MRLILSIGICFLTLSSVTGEADRASQFTRHVGYGKALAAHLETKSARARDNRGRIAASPSTDLDERTLAAAEEAPALTKDVQAPPTPQIATLPPSTSIPARATVSGVEPELSHSTLDNLNRTEAGGEHKGHTAIYDIAAHTVYLPGGEQLEAHSGLGRMRDDPRYAHVKGRGPTPPNVYDLTLRGGLFHGVRAIRLNPVAGSSMFGRDNILAHNYMLGENGQSFGCVSFKDYPKFLDAFLRGEISRIIVVPHLMSEPPVASVTERIASAAR